ncbi:efflux RND transporter periplasmic adaptor subunit [Alteromonas halophila]|uniref:RND superfamily efflux pump MFP component n=1 Tax=Alteromonas halophila TaxID=516698 RepID=A0A918N0T6_9ALTE|nr:efflux RND transporter periplasmic adaptor subunit [Alteromonas halophila]GGW95527.1 RND superfamily efflux pump MFP component [Alteromonas halophila]
MKQSLWMKGGIPLVVIVVAVIVAGVMISSRKPPEQNPVEEPAFLVDAQPVSSEQVQFSVTSQGNVLPKHETMLSTQVSGKVVSVSDAYVVGGMFSKGDTLVTLEQSDYETELRLAEAELAQATAALEEEIARGKVAEQEWRSVNDMAAPELGLRKPQLAKEQANVKAAKAKLDRARRNLARTEITAPYNGIVVERNIDLGQFVTAGAAVATLYATDVAEVRLPITDSDLAFLNVSDKPGNVDNVRLHATVAGKSRTWQGTLARTEGVLDSNSRVVYAVVNVNDPYRRDTATESVPLRFGQFVEASIQSEKRQQLFVLPRNVVRLDNTVLTVDDERTLKIKPVDIQRSSAENVYISSGLEEGDLVVMSAVPNPYDGMKVRLPDDIPEAAKNDKEEDSAGIASEEDE